MKKYILSVLLWAGVGYSGSFDDKINAISLKQKENYIVVTEEVPIDSLLSAKKVVVPSPGCKVLNVKLDKSNGYVDLSDNVDGTDSLKVDVVFEFSHSYNDNNTSLDFRLYSIFFRDTIDFQGKIKIESLCSIHEDKTWNYFPAFEYIHSNSLKTTLTLDETDVDVFYNKTKLIVGDTLEGEHIISGILTLGVNEDLDDQTNKTLNNRAFVNEVSSGKAKGFYSQGFITIPYDEFKVIAKELEVVIWWNWARPEGYSETPFSLSPQGENVLDLGESLIDYHESFQTEFEKLGFVHTIPNENYVKTFKLGDVDSDSYDDQKHYLDSIVNKDVLLEYHRNSENYAPEWAPTNKKPVGSLNTFYDNLEITTGIFTTKDGVDRALIILGDANYQGTQRVDSDLVDSLLSSVELWMAEDPIPLINLKDYVNSYEGDFFNGLNSYRDILPTNLSHAKIQGIYYSNNVDSYYFPYDPYLQLDETTTIQDFLFNDYSEEKNDEEFKWYAMSNRGDTLEVLDANFKTDSLFNDTLFNVSYSLRMSNENSINANQLLETGEDLDGKQLFFADSITEFTNLDLDVIVEDFESWDISDTRDFNLHKNTIIDDKYLYQLPLGSVIRIVDATGKILFNHIVKEPSGIIELGSFKIAGAKYIIVNTFTNQFVRILK